MSTSTCEIKRHRGKLAHHINPPPARWWVVRLDTGQGRRVCSRHISAAIEAIGFSEIYGGCHVEPLA